MAMIRRANAVWEGDLMTGSGAVSTSTSQAFSELPVTWEARTKSANNKTSPEELMAAAHASCFSMAFSNGLAKAGTPAQRLDVTAAVTFDQVPGGWKVTTSALTVKGKVAGIDEAGFKQAAEAAKDGCPISQAIKGNVQLSVEATLEQ